MLYINNKITKQEHNKTDYLKLFFLVFTIVFIIIELYIFNTENGGDMFDSGSSNYEMRGGNPGF